MHGVQHAQFLAYVNLFSEFEMKNPIQLRSQVKRLVAHSSPPGFESSIPQNTGWSPTWAIRMEAGQTDPIRAQSP